MAQVNRALTPDSVRSLHFLTQAGMRLEVEDGTCVATDAVGRTMTTRSVAVGEGIERLIERFPASSTLDDCAAAITADDDGEARELLLDALYRMLLAGMIMVASEPVHADQPGATPEAIALARADAAEGRASTTNLRHEPVALDPASRALLPAVDGSRDRAALATALADAALAGQIEFMRDGGAVRGAAAIREVANEHLPALLAGLANACLISG
jgi:hypothetical protein